MFIEASYSLKPEEIVMPGAIDPPRVRPRSRMTAAPAGEPETSNVRWRSYNNTSILEFFAHTGTHIDVPFHVDPDGLKMDQFELNDFIFEHPLLLEIPKQAKEKISTEDLEPHKEELARADILMIYTGFSKTRKKDPEGFVKNQPSLTLEAANYLVDKFNIRAYGSDTISIENIADGKAASPVQFPVHKVLLLKKKQKSFVIEDLNLGVLLGKNLRRFFVIPLRVFGAEAMPVTVFAEVDG
jgi:kynurenine formamidase